MCLPLSLAGIHGEVTIDHSDFPDRPPPCSLQAKAWASGVASRVLKILKEPVQTWCLIFPSSQTPFWGTQADGGPGMRVRSQDGSKAASSPPTMQPPTLFFDPVQTGLGAPCLFLSLGLSQGWNVGGLCGLGLPTLSELHTF